MVPKKKAINSANTTITTKIVQFSFHSTKLARHQYDNKHIGSINDKRMQIPRNPVTVPSY
jgi:hypothetical protein